MNTAIVLTHGLFMNKIVMSFMKKEFEELNYKVYNYGYKTVGYDNNELKKYDSFIKEIKEEQIIFVCHSLGGLLTHLYLKKHSLKNKKIKVITMGTPHYGSFVGRKIQSLKTGSFILGSAKDAGLLDGQGDWTQSNIPLGCIVGNLNIGLLNVLGKGSENGDGTVLREEAINKKATDFVELSLTHTALIYSSKVVEQIDSFIKTNKFKKEKS